MKLADAIEFLGLTEDEAISCLLSYGTPPTPSATRKNWKDKKAEYGENIPEIADFWAIQKRDRFQCQLCQSRFRLTHDHIDNDHKNHDLNNLRLLCFKCNRARSKIGTINENSTLRFFRAFWEIWKETSRVPLIKEINRKLGFNSRFQYLYEYLCFRVRLFMDGEEDVFVPAPDIGFRKGKPVVEYEDWSA